MESYFNLSDEYFVPDLDNALMHLNYIGKLNNRVEGFVLFWVVFFLSNVLN